MHTVLGGVGARDFGPAEFEVMAGVKNAHRIASPYKLVSRSFCPGGTIVRIGGVEIGGDRVVVMAGPCSVETKDQIDRIAAIVAQAGAVAIRRGAFKPRSSPYSFPGLGEKGRQLMREAANRHGLLVVSEVMDHTQIPLLAASSDIPQVGAPNLQDYKP